MNRIQHYTTEEHDGVIRFCEREYAPEFEAKSGALFAQGNGYLGIHGATALPTLTGTRGTLIAGLYHRPYPGEVEELVNGPDITRVNVTCDARELTGDGKSLVFFHRSFCPRTGELVTEQHFMPEEGTVLVLKERRFADFADPHRFFQQIEISLSEGEIKDLVVTAHLDGSVTNSGVSHFGCMEGRVSDGSVMRLKCLFPDSEEESGLNLCSRTTWSDSGEAASVFSLKRRGICESRKYSLKKGETVRLMRQTRVEMFGSLTREPETGMAVGTGACALTYEQAFSAHCEALGQHMDKAAIRIGGASLKVRAAIALAQYHLTAMVPWGRSDCCVGAKGLTGEGYKGHVFWDMEIFILPWLMLFYPDQARNSLIYRYRQLESARRKAEAYGYKGALFPWESAADGEEQTPEFAAMNIHTGKANPVWSARKEHHISADIGYAVLQYLHFTGDELFLQTYGMEMLLEISLFWCSRAKWDESKGAYVILDVIGPDEYTEHIDNNAYTNYMAREVMSGTLALAAGSKMRESALVRAWKEKLNDIRRVRDGLYLPQPNEEGIIPQDDTFLEKPMLPQISRYREAPVRQLVLQDYTRDQVVDMQVLKQADTVMLPALLPGLFNTEIVTKNIRYYAERTVHDSSLSYCMHARAFAQAGDPEEAFRFFEKSLEIDLNDNPREGGDGIHAAAMGGILGSILFGFAGVTAEDGKLHETPRLPSGWNSVEYPRRY